MREAGLQSAALPRPQWKRREMSERRSEEGRERGRSAKTDAQWQGVGRGTRKRERRERGRRGETRGVRDKIEGRDDPGKRVGGIGQRGKEAGDGKG